MLCDSSPSKEPRFPRWGIPETPFLTAGEKPHFSTRSSPKRPRASKVRDGKSCLPKSWSRRKPPSRRAEPLSDLLFLLCPTACLRIRLGRRRLMPPLSFRHGWADVGFTEEGGREWLCPGGVRLCRQPGKREVLLCVGHDFPVWRGCVKRSPPVSAQGESWPLLGAAGLYRSRLFSATFCGGGAHRPGLSFLTARAAASAPSGCLGFLPG